jgi:manganese/zinc/iron transport system permease protein
MADLFKGEELWIMVTALLVAASCSLVGYYLTLRRQSLFGDAVSHSLLPGLMAAYFVTGSLKGLPMLVGAFAASLVTSFLIEFIRKQTRLKEDTSMGIVFTSMFSLGVILLVRYASHVHIDTQCVLFGELLFVPLGEPGHAFAALGMPYATEKLLWVLAALAVLCALFHKEFVLVAFHEEMAAALGLPVRFFHYYLMALVSLAMVFSFELVGVILVVGFMVIPPSFGKLFFSRFREIYFSGLLMSAIAVLLAVPLSFHFNLNPAGLIVSTQFLFFLVAFAGRWAWAR